MKSQLRLLLLLMATIITLASQQVFDNLCTNPQVHRFLVVSEAKIERSKHLEFGLQLFDAPVAINRS
jgi:hypothetical protein